METRRQVPPRLALTARSATEHGRASSSHCRHLPAGELWPDTATSVNALYFRVGFGPGLRSSLRYAITDERRSSQSRAGLIPAICPVCSKRVRCLRESPVRRDASATVTYSSSGN
jgi:hypothetical protein